MATIKAYTDLSQSKTLSKILPLESADMHYCLENRDVSTGYEIGIVPFIQAKRFKGKCNIVDVQPAWSLAALLSVLPDNYVDANDTIYHPNLMKTKDGRYMVIYNASQYTSLYNNPVDACYEMVIKLYELNML